jgi:hypothetical protein
VKPVRSKRFTTEYAEIAEESNLHWLSVRQRGRPVKVYVITTGALFALIAIAHAVRVAVEGVHLIAQPVFLLTTLASLAVCVWALVLLKSSRPMP